MKIQNIVPALCLCFPLQGSPAYSGPVDPDCTAEKAAKSTAMKATVGVGGRCSPAEAARDTSTEAVKDAVGIEDKGPLEKHRDDEKPAEKAINNVTR